MPSVLLEKTWRVDGVLTNATEVLLSDPTETFGIKRNDTGEAVVADETAVENPSAGIYRYNFTALEGVAYTAFFEVRYAGATYHFEQDIPAFESSAYAVDVNHAQEHCAAPECDADMIGRLVRAATAKLQSDTSRQFITANQTLRLDCFPSTIELRTCPVQSVTSVKYYDSDGVQQTLDASDYIADTASEPGRIVPVTSWPATQKRPGAVEVTFVAGYGSKDDVPHEARHAILLLVGHLYANREAASGQAITEVPMAYRSLMQTLRWTW